MDDQEVVEKFISSPTTSKQSSNLSNKQVVPFKFTSKEIQTRNNGKKKTKIIKRKKDISDKCTDSIVFIDPEDQCVRHSFCVVKSLKEKGVRPLKPKGLPWSTGLLLYLPGHKPSNFEKSKQGQAELSVKKKKKLKQKLAEKKRIMKRLREGDHKKLCDVLNTSQELMILMRVMSLYAEKRKIESNRLLNAVQTEFEVIPDEEGENEEEMKDDDSEVMEDNEEGEEKERLPENFLETE